MALPQVEITGRDIEITDAIRNYINEKIAKYDSIFDMATSIEVECISQTASKGSEKDFKVEVMMHLPKTDARVEKEGVNLYAIIDEATDVLVRKVKRYKDRFNQWEGVESWKIVDTGVQEEPENDVHNDPYVADYVPKVIRRKKLENNTPISEAEAIEKMEMLGYEAYLFKNQTNGKYCMVYKRKKGGYGVIEPAE